MPALPQADVLTASGSSSMPGIDRRRSRGRRAGRQARCARWQRPDTRRAAAADGAAPAAGRARRRLYGDVRAQRAAKVRARSAHTGSFASRTPYSFIEESTPGALTAMRSSLRARRLDGAAGGGARFVQPAACSASAPQHPCPAAPTHRRQPSAARHVDGRGVDARKHEALAHPDRRPNRHAPCARRGRSRGTPAKSDRKVTVGASSSIARSRAKHPIGRHMRRAFWLPCAAFSVQTSGFSVVSRIRARGCRRRDPIRPGSRSAGVRRSRMARTALFTQPTTTSGASATRKRRGNGNSAKIALRNSRSPSERE